MMPSGFKPPPAHMETINMMLHHFEEHRAKAAEKRKATAAAKAQAKAPAVRSFSQLAIVSHLCISSLTPSPTCLIHRPILKTNPRARNRVCWKLSQLAVLLTRYFSSGISHLSSEFTALKMDVDEDKAPESSAPDIGSVPASLHFKKKVCLPWELPDFRIVAVYTDDLSHDFGQVITCASCTNPFHATIDCPLQSTTTEPSSQSTNSSKDDPDVQVIDDPVTVKFKDSPDTKKTRSKDKVRPTAVQLARPNFVLQKRQKVRSADSPCLETDFQLG